MTDRILGHPQSIDALVAIDENTVCTGSSDGLIRCVVSRELKQLTQCRVVSVHPNKLLGVVGEHEDFPVERLALSGDKDRLVEMLTL